MKQAFTSAKVKSKAESESFSESLKQKEDNMKTTLALLIAGLLCLATPMLASADRGHNHRQNDSHGWVKQHQHNAHAQYNRNHRHYNNKRNVQVKRHLKKELRRTRQELHQVKRQIKHQRQRTYHAQPAVVIGIPHLVFQFDW